MKKARLGLYAVSFAFVCASAVAIAQEMERVTSWSPLGGGRHIPPMSPSMREAYQSAIARTASMASDPVAGQLAQALGLNVMNLTWEDTGRYKDSAVGPNISDMTIQVGYGQDGATSRPRCMPVIRYPNFADKTCDIDPSDFTLLVGNEHGKNLQRASLRDFLADPTQFLTHPSSWLGSQRTLLAPRDSKVLVSAQACFLPVPKQGLATFNPVLFNYRSVSGDPAVLTILVTREGASTSVIDNKRDSFADGSTWGQRLFLNENGERANLTGQRMSDFHAAPGEIGSGPGLNMVLLIQVPLVQRLVRSQGENMFGYGGGIGGAAAAKSMAGRRGVSDVESAVIGHGDAEGEFTEIDNLAIRRDPNLPVRVTVQFYKATSNGIVTQSDMDDIKHEIDRVYEHGENVGSLVVDGQTGRPTEYVGCKVQPAGWWNDFWNRYEENTGMSRTEATQRLRRLLGPDYYQRPVCELYLRDMLENRTAK